MNSSKQSKWSIVAAIFLILLGLGIVVLAGIWAFDLFQKLDPPKATLLAAAIGILGVITAQSLTGTWNRKLDKERAHLARRTEAYENLVASIIGMITSKGDQKKIDDHVIAMSKFGVEVIVWGSSDVLHAWNQYRHRLMHTEKQKLVETDFLKLSSDLLKAIRKDLGHKDKGKVHDSDLLMPFINDARSGQDYPPMSTPNF